MNKEDCVKAIACPNCLHFNDVRYWMNPDAEGRFTEVYCDRCAGSQDASVFEKFAPAEGGITLVEVDSFKHCPHCLQTLQNVHVCSYGLLKKKYKNWDIAINNRFGDNWYEFRCLACRRLFYARSCIEVKKQLVTLK